MSIDNLNSETLASLLASENNKEDFESFLNSLEEELENVFIS